MLRCIVRLLLIIILLNSPGISAHAVQWKSLNGTTRFKVAYDEDSVRLSPGGRLEIWLRFIPRGESERKSAALDYKDKRYRSHLEFYEIDCSDNSEQLGLVDVLGPSLVRLKRIQGEPQSEPILPGSVLDDAAQQICPVLDADSDKENESMETDTAVVLITPEDITMSNDQKLQLELLLKKSATNDATAETWKEIGNIYFDTDQTEKAISAYEKSLLLQPDDIDVLNDQGAMYRQVGDFERALANFEKAMALSPHNLESLYNSGYIYAFDLNNIPKALTLWRNYLEQESYSETARQVQSFIERYGK